MNPLAPLLKSLPPADAERLSRAYATGTLDTTDLEELMEIAEQQARRLDEEEEADTGELAAVEEEALTELEGIFKTIDLDTLRQGEKKRRQNEQQIIDQLKNNLL